MEVEFGKIVEELAGNGILGVVLAWFMVQHGHIIKALMERLTDNTKAMQKVADVIERCNKK